MSWLSDVNNDIRAGLLRAVPDPVWDWMYRMKKRKQDRIDEEQAEKLSKLSPFELDYIWNGAHFGGNGRNEDLIRQVQLAERLRKERKKQEMEAGG